MELGAGTFLPGSPNVLGVSWTNSKSGMLEGSDMLVTTTPTLVQVHSMVDTLVPLSWLILPGSSTRFTVATVQHRVWRKFFAVQDGRSLLAWHERDSSLERALRVGPLREDVFTLRVSKHVPALVVVYQDGGVGVFNERLVEEQGAPGVGGGMKATWVRLTSIPGQPPGKCVLMVLMQGGEGGGKKGGKAASPGGGSAPILRVFTLSEAPAPASTSASATTTTTAAAAAAPATSSSASGGSGGGGITLRLVATHTLPIPSNSPSTITVSAITLHKKLAQLGIVWSTGYFSMLQFARGSQWFASSSLKEVMSRHLVGVTGGGEVVSRKGGSALTTSSSSSSSSTAGKGPFQCAAFALEPSCVVLAGENGKGGVGMSVWDVRYGVVLSSRSDVGGGDEVRSGGGIEGLGGGKKRQREASQVSASSSSPPPPPPPPTTTAAATPSPLSLSPLHVTVSDTDSDNGSFVAVLFGGRVCVSPVAVRGASLASAYTRMAPTAVMLREGGLGAFSHPAASAPISLDKLEKEGVFGSGMGGGGGEEEDDEEEGGGVIALAAGGGKPLKPTAMASWTAALNAQARDVSKILGMIMDVAKTPTASTLEGVLIPYGGLTGTSPLPAPVAIALRERLVVELRGVVDHPERGGSGPGFLALLHSLVVCCRGGNGCFGDSLAMADLVALLLDMASLPPITPPPHAHTGACHPLAVPSLHTLATLLASAPIIPEDTLVVIFQALIHRVTPKVLRSLWGEGSGSGSGSGRGGKKGATRGVGSTLSFMLFTGLLVKAPRNDVFMEKSLCSLSLRDVELLLGCLVRLTKLHATDRDVVVVEGEGEASAVGGSASSKKKKVEGGGGSEGASLPYPPLPPLDTILDWLRLTIDAHYPSLVLQGQLQARKEASLGVKTPPESLLGLLKASSRIITDHVMGDSAVGVKGLLEHLLCKLPLPKPPMPEYIVEKIRV